MRNYLLYILLRAGASLIPSIPVAVTYFLASVAGRLAFQLAHPARRAIDANLRLAFPNLPLSVRQRLALAAFRNNAMNWADTLRIPSLDLASAPALIDVDGWELIERAAAARTGAVLAFLHVGNYDLVGQALIARGYRLTVAVERVQPERLYRFLVQQREAQGIRLVPAEQASRGLLRALRAGELVGVAVDRRASGRGVEAEFFGHRCEFARGAAGLARHTGAPLLVCVAIRRGGSTFKGFVVPVPVPHTGDAHTDEIEATRGLVTVVERFVRSYPDQWLAFAPVCQ